MPSLPSPVTSPAPAHHAGGRPSRANVAAKTFQCTECSAVLLSPTEFQLHIDRRHMNGNDSNNDEDSDVEAVSEDDFGKNSMDGKAVNGGGNKPKSAPSSSPKSTASSSPSEDLRCSFCSKHFTRKLDLAHHLESMHCRERCLYVGSGGECGAVFTGKQSIVCHIESQHSRPSPTKTCKVCGVSAGTETRLLNHILAEHIERACGMCNLFKTTATSAKDENSLLDHIRQKHSFYVFVKKCEWCPSVFRDQAALADHHAAVHQERYCKPCSLTFRGVWRYREHVREKHPLAERELNVNNSNSNHVVSGRKNSVAATEASKTNVQAAAAPVDTATFLAPAPPPPQPPSSSAAAAGSSPGGGLMTVRCPLCSYQSSQKSNLTRHFESFHLTYKCRICRARVHGRKKIIEHVHQNHGSTDTRYDIKDADVKREVNLLNRALAKPTLHSGSSNAAAAAPSVALHEYKCPRCPFVAHYRLAWIQHKSVCHKSATPDGGAGKSNEENRVRGLTPVERRHANQAKNYACPKCVSRFRTARSTALHLKEEHGVRCVVKKDEAGNKIVVEETRKRKRSASSKAAAAAEAEKKAKAASSNASSAAPSNHNSDTETAFEDDGLTSAPAAAANGLADPNSPPDPFLKRDLAKKFRLEYESYRKWKIDEFHEYLKIADGIDSTPDEVFDRSLIDIVGSVDGGGVAVVVEMKDPSTASFDNFVPAAISGIYD